jgi:uncharacterized membrane protein YdbT with pleckstrin-like domain
MPFPRRLLNDDEDVVLDLRPHWWALAGPAVGLVLAVAAGIAALVAVHVDAVRVAVAIVIGVALLAFLIRFARWSATNFVVTTDRLIFRSGVLAKSGREIPLDRINDITYRQTIFQRLLRAGDLMIESAGERGQETFATVPRPELVQNEIYRQMQLGRNNAVSASASREPSIPEQLEKLDELRQRGVISQAEFDAKKAQLLDRL